MSKGNRRSLGTGWGACKVIAFWWLVIGLYGIWHGGTP